MKQTFLFAALLGISVAGGLVLAMILSDSVVNAQDLSGAEYIGSSQCKVCHSKESTGNQYGKWQSMKHANAFKVLASEEAIAAAKERGIEKPPQEAPECLKCHVSGYNAETKEFHAKLKKEDGVQCESCHGPSSLHAKDGKAVQFKLGDYESIDMSLHTKQIEEKDCLVCHNDESPTWDPERYTKEDGTKVGFDFEQAKKKIAHPRPEKE